MAVSRILQGGHYLPPPETEHNQDEGPHRNLSSTDTLPATLSDREIEVLQWIAQGRRLTEPYELGEALQAARSYLEPKHPEAYLGYDQLLKKDKDAQRTARLENILGAIRNNMEQIPELKDRLKDLVKEWK